MSKVKSKYFEFINSEDYSEYYLHESSVSPKSSVNYEKEILNYSHQGVSSQELQKRLKQRFSSLQKNKA